MQGEAKLKTEVTRGAPVTLGARCSDSDAKYHYLSPSNLKVLSKLRKLDWQIKRINDETIMVFTVNNLVDLPIAMWFLKQEKPTKKDPTFDP